MHCTLETDIHIPRLGFHFHIFTLPFKILLLAGERGGYFWTGNTISSVQILEESSQKYFMQEDSYLKQGMH